MKLKKENFTRMNKMNVKPKFLNVMKRFLVTMMALFALVIMANKTFAQAETAPIVGASYTYSVSPLSVDDTFGFSVNTSTTTTGGSVSETIGTSTGTVPAGGTISTTITWYDAGTTRNLWVELTSDATGCTNQRYIEITPVANEFDLTIIALGTQVSADFSGFASVTSTTATDCMVYSTGFDFSDASATTSDGSSYAFYSISPTTNGSSTWNLTSFTTTNGLTPSFSTDGTTWTASTSTIGSSTKLLARVLVPNIPAGTTEDATIAGTENTGDTGTLAEVNTDNNTASFSVNAFPDLGTGTSTIFN